MRVLDLQSAGAARESGLISRYTRPEMGHVWSEENRFQKWLAVELAAAETLAEAGIVPVEAAAKLRERARVDVARINEIEAKVRHDVIAFTIAVQETVADPEPRAGCTTASLPTTWWTPRRRCSSAKPRT